MGQENESATHVFISYSHADSVAVDQLRQCLESAGLQVWRDTADLWPGQDRRGRIRQAITSNALVFIACFSTSSLARVSSPQNEELTLAVEEFRRRPVAVPWIIPVRFDACQIPDLELGGGRDLRSIQRADLFGSDAARGLDRLVTTIRGLAGERAAVSKPAPDRQPPHQADQGRLACVTPGDAGRKLDVLGTRGSQSLRQSVVDLMDRQAGVFLTLRIGPAEVVSIAYAKKGISAEPDPAYRASYVLPHDVLVLALEAVDVPLVSAELRGAPNRALLARLTLANGRAVVSAPADAIVLALRARIPLFAPEGLLDQADPSLPGQLDDQAWLAGAVRRDQAVAKAATPATAATGPVPGMVPVTVTGIGAGAEPDEPTALLKAEPGGWTTPVSVSPIEAVAIDAARRGELGNCQSAHLLFPDLMSTADAALSAAVITMRPDGTAGAELMLSAGQPVPARVGDSLALALLTRANIFAAADLPASLRCWTPPGLSDTIGAGNRGITGRTE